MSALRITAFLVAIALSSSSVVQSPNKRDGTFELLILHNNDMHARFEQTSQLSSTCTTANREAGKCYGGFPRVAHVVKEARKAAASGEGPPVLYLNAGDTYTGTAWFTIYKWKIAAEFINALQPDAVSLGNNDLMRGSNKISPLLNHLQSPILATNVMVKNEQAMNEIRKSLIVNIEGKKVALLGYLTPERNLLDNTDNIEYIDEVLALKEEVDKLRALNVDIIIVLGHSTDDSKNLEIATEVDGIDLVIAGRKNTFAWDGRTIDAEIKPNPVFITQASGKRVLVVQSHSYDKYLGSLIVTFNSDGDIAKYSDNSILLDETVRQDKDAVQIVINIMEEITEPSSEVIGFTAVVLDGESCKTAECNLGNLITDAIMYYYAVNYEGDTWTDAPIAIIHSGAIGASIAPSVRPASITRGDLMRALPFESKLVAVTMNGTTLKQVLEHAVANYSIENPSNHFLQFSGLRVEYDLSKEPGNRLLTAVARCWSCFVPVFFAIENFTSYKVLMPFALANGEFGYSMLDHLPTQELPYDEFQCVTEFISQRSPVYPEVAERLVLFGLDSLEVNSTVSPTEITATPTAESTTVELSTSVLTETTTEEILEITTEQILETTTGTDSAAAITSTVIVVISVFITMVIS